MGWLKNESAYDRRIRELEEEADRVRKSMQQLMKGSHREVSSRVEGRTTASAGEAASLQRPPAFRKTADFRRPVEPVAPVEEQSAPEDESISGVAPANEYPPRSSAPSTPERLASFLASGSFGKSGPLSRERKIQRNKALVMLILAVIALYSLFVWLGN